MEIVRLDFTHVGLGNSYSNRAEYKMSSDAHTEKLPELIPEIKAVSVAPQPIEQSIDGVQVIEAPVTVVAPGTINTGGGTAIQGDVSSGGGNFTGRDDTRYSSVGSQQLFISPDNAALWQASMQLLKDMQDIAIRLDNIPNRIEALEKFLHTPSVVVPAVNVPITAAISVPLQSWLLIILIFLILLAGGIWISLMIGRIL